MTLDNRIRAEIIYELKTSAFPSDQKIADKIGVSRGTVWNKRKEIESEIDFELVIDNSNKLTLIGPKLGSQPKSVTSTSERGGFVI